MKQTPQNSPLPSPQPARSPEPASEEDKGKTADDDSVIIIDIIASTPLSSPAVVVPDQADPVPDDVVEIALPEYASAKRRLEQLEAGWLTNTQSGKRGCCNICYERKTLWASPCGHVCCKQCWRRWLEEHRRCPVCRRRTRIMALSTLS